MGTHDMRPVRAFSNKARMWVGCLACLALLLAACHHPGRGTEVARTASPDGALDAVLTEYNPGATASFVYRIHLVRHGAPWRGSPPAAELYGATRSVSAYGVNLRWRDKHTLVARYLDAKSVKQPAKTVHVGKGEITLILKPGVADKTAPAGGMAHAASQAHP